MWIWIGKKLLAFGIGKLLSGIAVSALLVWGYSAVRNHFIEAENTRTQLSNMTIKYERERVSRESMEMVHAIEKTHDIEVAGLRAAATAEMAEIRKETQKHKDVLADRERLERLSKAKPGLLSKLGNKATKKRMEELENIYNR